MNPLEQLKDIYQPAEPSWWPLAYGWWIALALVFIAISLAIWALVIRHRKRLAKKQALATLATVPGTAQSSQYNALLKRAAMAYFPSLKPQQLYGQPWADFLTQTLGENHSAAHQAAIQHLALQRYQANQSFDTQVLHDFTQCWLSRALPPSPRKLADLEVRDV